MVNLLRACASLPCMAQISEYWCVSSPQFRAYPSTVLLQLSLLSLQSVSGGASLLCCGCLIGRIFPLFCLYSSCSLLSCSVTSGHLAFLAVDWLRTVSASHPLFLFLLFPADRAPSYLLSLTLFLWFQCCAVRPPPPFLSLPGSLSPLVLSLLGYLSRWIFGLVLLALPAYPVLSLLFG